MTPIFSKHRSRLARACSMVVLAGVLAGGALVSGAHAASSRAATNITFWGPFSGPDGKTLVSMVDAFNSSQSAVHVALTINPNGNYDTSLSTAIAAHKTPNLFVGDDVFLSQVASQGIAQPLDKTLTSIPALSKKQFYASLWNGGNYQGKQYGIPMDALPLVLYYNKSMFRNAGLNPKKPPTNEKTFLAYAKKLTKGSAVGFDAPTDWIQPFLFPTVLAQFGGKEMNVGSKSAAFNSSAGVKALQLMHDWVYKYKIAKAVAPDVDLKDLQNGTAAMIPDGPWQYTPLHAAMGSNLGVASVPQWGPKPGVFVGQHYLILSKPGASAAINKASLTFAKYFETHSIEWAKAGDLPAFKPTLNSKAFKKLTYEAALVKSLKHGVLSPKLPKYNSFNSTLYPQISLVMHDKKDAKSALDFAADQTTKAAQSTGG
jgi:multiple sugar transport system substrate-binding protein